jgi:hypothetical protein
MIFPGQPKNTQEETMSPMPFRSSHALVQNSIVAGGKLLLCAALMASTGAFAAAKKPAKESGKKLPAKVTFVDSSSGETSAARAKRLQLECKGRPNAGMCLGHTR